MGLLRQFIVCCDRCDVRLSDQDGFDFWDTEDAAKEAADSQSWENTEDGDWLCTVCYAFSNGVA